MKQVFSLNAHRYKKPTILVVIAGLLLFVSGFFLVFYNPDNVDENIRVMEFSPDLIVNNKSRGITTLVVVRSKYSGWNSDWLKNEQIERDLRSGKLAIAELIWDWEMPGKEKHYFDIFGFTKEAFVVVEDLNQEPYAFVAIEFVLNSNQKNWRSFPRLATNRSGQLQSPQNAPVKTKNRK